MTENKQGGKLLIVEDDEPLRKSCARLFRRRKYHVATAAGGRDALDYLGRAEGTEVVLADLKMPGMDGIELLLEIRRQYKDIQVIIMTGYATIETAVKAIKLGASDYVTKPFEPDELLRIVDRACEVARLRGQVKALTLEIERSGLRKGMVGSSKAMQAVYAKIAAAATAPSPVLIYGETGTGKELVAHAIHDAGPRAKNHFVAVNCAAFASELIDRELFGHTKGAFTGADRDQPGLFQEASQGTLFLDEISEMSLHAQAKLLRAIQDGKIRPLGSSKEIEARPRIISATNREPASAVRDGLLRQDLYYRLKVFDITVPPLRERKEDIPLLSNHFIQQSAQRLAKDIRGLEDAALERLVAHPWPGNVRELENVLEGAVAVTISDSIQSATIQSLLGQRQFPDSDGAETQDGIPTLDAMAQSLAARAVRTFDGNKSQAAKALGISRKKLYDLLSNNPRSIVE